MATASLSPIRATSPEKDGHAIGLLRIPRAAHTLSGFRAWVLGEDFPEKLKEDITSQRLAKK